LLRLQSKDKIRQALKEVEFKDAEMGREPLYAGLKTGKLNLMMEKYRVWQRKRYTTVSDFYQEIAHEKLDMHVVRMPIWNWISLH